MILQFKRGGRDQQSAPPVTSPECVARKRTPLLRHLFALAFLLLTVGVSHSANNKISFDYSIPASGSEVSSFDNISLVFDISKIQAAYPQYDRLGICSTAIEDFDPEWANAIILYKGKPDDGNILSSLYETRTVSSPNFEVGNKFTFSFPSIVVEEGQEYTVKIFYSFDVGQSGLSSDESRTLTRESVLSLDYYSSIDLTFTGKAETEKLAITGVVPESASTLETLGNITLSFNTAISVAEGAVATLLDNGQTTDMTGSLSVVGGTDLSISFDNVPLYKTHTYSVVLNEGAITSDLGESPKYELEYIGDTWNHFQVKRGQTPLNDSEVIDIDKIYIPFEFPEGYGFKATSGTPPTYTANLYKGGQEGELVGTYVLENSVSGNSIEGDVDVDLEPGTEYAIVIPEGQLTIRNLNGVGALEGWTNGEIVINVTTPSVDALGKVALTSAIGESMEEIAGKLRIAVAPYTYNDETYEPVISGDAVVIFNEEGRRTEHAVELVKGEDGTYLQTVGDVNATLFAGKEYSVIVPANTVTLQHSFLGRYTGNAESEFEITGTTPTSVKVSYIVTDGSELTTTVARGEAVTFTPVPAEGWKVETVTLDGESVDPQGEAYVTPALLKDAEITVTYAYDGEIRFVDLSGVNEVTLDGGYTVGKDGEFVVVSNLKEGDAVTVYTVNGQQVASHKATLDVLKISLPTGLYIVRINNVTFKLKH